MYIYALSERQSMYVTNQAEQCMRGPEATSVRANKTLVRDLKKVRVGFEAAEAGRLRKLTRNDACGRER